MESFRIERGAISGSSLVEFLLFDLACLMAFLNGVPEDSDKGEKCECKTYKTDYDRSIGKWRNASGHSDSTNGTGRPRPRYELFKTSERPDRRKGLFEHTRYIGAGFWENPIVVYMDQMSNRLPLRTWSRFEAFLFRKTPVTRSCHGVSSIISPTCRRTWHDTELTADDQTSASSMSRSPGRFSFANTSGSVWLYLPDRRSCKEVDVEEQSRAQKPIPAPR